jgi:hypothetical protein
VKDRDFVLIIYRVFVSKDEFVVAFDDTVEANKVDKDCVRGSAVGGYKLIREGDQTRFIYATKSDLKGSIPT